MVIPPIAPGSLEVSGVSIGRVLDVAGEPPSRVVAATCAPRCDLAVDTGEPVALVLLAASAVAIAARRAG